MADTLNAIPSALSADDPPSDDPHSKVSEGDYPDPIAPETEGSRRDRDMN